MDIYFRESVVEDAPTLLRIQKAAFKDDLLKYEDFDTNPACESIELLEYNIMNFHHLTIEKNCNQIIGAIDIRRNKERIHINKIFIDQEIQNKGIGTYAMQHIESLFTDVSLWTLYTPSLSFRNHHLYEKLGYKKVKEIQVNDKLVLFKYDKTTH
ncbi:acetyltransferase [Paenibacillus silvae]|uniref:Acetyltransferase n=1 Tax=Paenibacillus silvae TaxID=1325358 RepID=A0ABQ1Z5F8_9BACL|nr:GNAT family N-acetyltransferase [Paenibacillus silvae]GGH50365.1 acetyltransferase [Paenibacillus silvae]